MARRKSTAKKAMADPLDAALKAMQARIMSTSATAPPPRWGRVHAKLREITTRAPERTAVRSAFLIPLA